MVYIKKKKKYGHIKNLILKYIGMKNINILNRKQHVEINVVFLELILKLYDVYIMKNIVIAPWRCLHCFDLHINMVTQKCQERIYVCIVLILYIAVFCIIFVCAVFNSLWLLVFTQITYTVACILFSGILMPFYVCQRV